MDILHTLAAELASDRVAGAEPSGAVRSIPLATHRTSEALLGSALVDVVRRLLREELEARVAEANRAPRSPWMTPPAAARLTRIPVKTIRAWARAGRIPKRIKNRAADPKQQKYLVNVDDVVAVAEQVAGAPAETSDKLELQKRAEERAAQVLAARAAKGR